MTKKKGKTPENTIARNKKARFEYSIEDKFEAGLVLEGWEVKSLRAGKVQINESYILLKDREALPVRRPDHTVADGLHTCQARPAEDP